MENLVELDRDDRILCAFGPEYFDGARYGSGVGSIVSFVCARRAYRLVRDEHIASQLRDGVKLSAIPKATAIATLRKGFRTHPFYVAGMLACSLTGVAKVVKWSLAFQRMNEFRLDDLEFGELQAWAKLNPETAKVFDDFCKDEMCQKAPAGAGVGDLDPDAVGRKTSMSAALVAKHAHAHREAGVGDTLLRRRPTFWDGVAVGVLGSIMDCYLPTKPVSMYYDMHCGIV